MGKGQEVVVVKKNIGNSFLAEGMRRNDGIVFFDGNKILKNGLFHYLGLFIHLEGETKEGATCRKDYKMFVLKKRFLTPMFLFMGIGPGMSFELNSGNQMCPKNEGC